MLFYKATTDGKRLDVTPSFRHSAAAGSCWLVGAGPSLNALTDDELFAIQYSPAAKFAMNYAGRGGKNVDHSWLIRPTHWTTYDPTVRFSSAVYNDPTITKFFRSGRAMDITDSGKLCDVPSSYFFESEYRDYENFLNPNSDKILDCQDSMIQALDIAVMLGYRKIYCVGMDMRVRVSPDQKAAAEAAGVRFVENDYVVVEEPGKPEKVRDLLSAVLVALQHKGIERDEALALMESAGREEQYAFGELKEFRAAVHTDDHYWRRAQHLRLAKKNLAINGVEIINCTPGSRLERHFLSMQVLEACADIESRTGGVWQEDLIGKYTADPAKGYDLDRDIQPHGAVKRSESGIKDAQGQVVEIVRQKVDMKALLNKGLKID